MSKIKCKCGFSKAKKIKAIHNMIDDILLKYCKDESHQTKLLLLDMVEEIQEVLKGEKNETDKP